MFFMDLTLGMRMKQRAKELGLSDAEVARRAGIEQRTYANYVLDKRFPKQEALIKIAKVLETTPNNLFGFTERGLGTRRQGGASTPHNSDTSGGLEAGFRRIAAWEKPEDLPEGQYVFIPRSYARLSAGSGELFFTDEEGPELAFTTRWIKARGLYRSSLVLVKARGDSMEPRIRDGDTLLVHRLRDGALADGKIYAIRYGDELRVKRLFRRYDGGWLIRSDNADRYPDEIIPPDASEHFEVLGRVVWVAGNAE